MRDPVAEEPYSLSVLSYRLASSRPMRLKAAMERLPPKRLVGVPKKSVPEAKGKLRDDTSRCDGVTSLSYATLSLRNPLRSTASLQHTPLRVPGPGVVGKPRSELVVQRVSKENLDMAGDLHERGG